MPYAPISYASAQSALSLTRRGTKVAASITPTLFEAKHSLFAQTMRSGYTPSRRSGATPQPLSKSTTARASSVDSSATQESAMLCDPGPSQSDRDRLSTGFVYLVHAGGYLRERQSPVTPVRYRSQVSMSSAGLAPDSLLSPNKTDVNPSGGAHRSEQTATSATANSLKCPHHQTTLRPKEPGRTLNPREVNAWTLARLREERISKGSDGGFSSRRL
jgi:hypothetical protein